MTGAAKNTVTKLLVDLGAACAEYQDRTLRDLPCTTIQADEIWAYCYSKQKNVPEEHRGTFGYGYGDVWTWTAICADTKLVPSWLVGERTATDALAFMTDLESRLANAVQLTTDGHHNYLRAVDRAFREHWIDYAMLQKIYGAPVEDQRWYSPPVCTGTEARVIKGNPEHDKVSTSYVERQNLTMRMGMRRFTRLTNAFSKKVENLAHAVSLHYMHYNFARPHKRSRSPTRRLPLWPQAWPTVFGRCETSLDCSTAHSITSLSRRSSHANPAAHASTGAPAQTDPLPSLARALAPW
jgi:IS1 family transposase